MAETTSTTADRAAREQCAPLTSDITETTPGADGTKTSAGDGRLREMYEAYSTQDLEHLLTYVTDEVNWPDGDRRMHGKAEVRKYWTEQWARIHTRDVVAVVARLSDSVRVIRIDQTVRAPTGGVISRGTFAHVLQLDGQLISRLDIVPLSTQPLIRPLFRR